MIPSAKRLLRASFMSEPWYPSLTSQVSHKAAWTAYQAGYKLREEMAIKPKIHFHYSIDHLIKMSGGILDGRHNQAA